MNMNSSQSDSGTKELRLLPLLALLVCGGGLAFVLFVKSADKPAPVDNTQPGETTEQTQSDVASEPTAEEDSAWESEQYSEMADAALQRLVELLDAPAEISSDALSASVSSDIESTSLRPAKFDERFQTASLTVRRGINVDSGSSTRGAKGFAESLRGMSEPLAEATHIHTKFKIISVQLTAESSVSTDIIFQRAGDLPQGSFQQDAVWNCIWKKLENQNAAGAVQLIRVSLLEYEEAVVSSPERHIYSDCTESVFRNEPSFQQQLLPGIDYWRSLIQKQYGVFPFGHHGIAVGDVNNDGLDDLYSGQPAGLPNRLYVQNPDGTVTDAAASAGVDLRNRTHGVLLLDFDNDGDQDLIAVLEQIIILMANDGAAHFTEKAAIPTSEPGSLSAADYDLDGDIDVYVVNYGDRFRSTPDVYHDANNGGANVLLRNDRDWNFVDVTVETGLDVNNRRWSFAASWEDFDDDGDPDVYVANDFGRNNLYRNDAGTFTDIAAQAGVEDIAAGMSASWADYDHDGRMDLYVGNMFSSAGLRITGQSRFQKRANETVRDEFKRHARGNTLFRNIGDGNFEDVSVPAGVTVGRWAWASKFVDINNDGWEDLVVANGFVTGHQTKDL